MEAEVYPDEKIISLINENYIPARAHIKEQPQTFDRFRAVWTPTQLVLNGGGVECYRIEGFLPVEDFAAQLEMGLAKYEFMKQRYAPAQEKYRLVCVQYGDTSAAPEACYWQGVSAYKATNNPQFLGEAGKVLKEKFPESEWTRKASVWVHEEPQSQTEEPQQARAA